MDLKQLVILALQVSVVCMVFGFGLKTTPHDLLYLIRRPGLLVRSLLAVFVVMPVVAVLLSVLFDFGPTVERALIALAVSPVPPLLPQKESKAGGDEHYALGLMAIVALMAMAVIPLEVLILQSVAGRPLEMASGAVVRVVLISTLLPLAAGMAVRSFMPGLVARIEKPVAMIANVLLPLALLLLLAGAAPAILALIGRRPHPHRHVRVSGRRTCCRPRAGPAQSQSLSGARVVDRLPASSDRAVNRRRELPGGALRRHHPALRAAWRHRRGALHRLAATAAVESAPAGVMLLICGPRFFRTGVSNRVVHRNGDDEAAATVDRVPGGAASSSGLLVRRLATPHDSAIFTVSIGPKSMRYGSSFFPSCEV